MSDWLQSLDARERLFVYTGAGVVLLALIWALAILPLSRAYAEREANVAVWQQSLDDLKPLVARAAAGGISQPGRSVSNDTPVVIVDQTLRSRALNNSLKRSQPTTQNGIRVEFENIAFDDLVLWLGDLSAQYGLEVAAGSFSSQDRNGPGRINATLTLERSP